MTAATAFPTTPEELDAARLTQLISELHPGARVDRFHVVESKVYGDGMVSTAGRIILDLDYGAGSPKNLPRRVVLKVARGDFFPKPLYSNEVAFYGRLRREVPVEAPLALGCGYDPGTGTFGLLMEDLRTRGATFPTVKTEISLEQLRRLLDGLAGLHAAYWQSPRFAPDGDLAWVETHVRGDLHDLFNDPSMVPGVIAHLVQTVQFKREMVERLGTTVDDLFAGVRRLHQHHAKGPQTLLHGDPHIGNTYLLPDGGGFLDWQLMVRGCYMHDVAYLIVTALSVGQRRAHERDLLAYYLEQLKTRGVAQAPGWDEAWLDYRRAHVWCVYIGWLTTPVENYGWEICVLSHLRVMTAFEDHGTRDLVAALPG